MKIIRYTLFTLLSLVLIVTATIAVVINFIFTPAKLSPIVEKAVNENLNAKLSLRSVELTFFSTFPHFSVEIDEGVLESYAKDTLIRFKQVNVTVNPIALIKDKRVEVSRIQLTEPIINARVSEEGAFNWDVMKSSQDSLKVDDSDTTKQAKNQLANISLSNIQITDGEILLDDRMKKIYANLKDIDMTLDGNMAAELSDMKLNISFSDAILWHDGKLLAKKLNLATQTKLELNTQTRQMKIEDSFVDINDVKFSLAGTIDPDSVDVNLSLHIPTLQSILALVPFIDNSRKVTTKGNVKLDAHIAGGYKNGVIPVVVAELLIEKASLKYEGMKNGIDRLNLKASLMLDLQKKSSLKITNIDMLGASTSINLRGSIYDLMGDAKISYSTNSSVNMTELAATLPLKEGLTIGGIVNINSEGEFTKSQIETADYAHIKAMGEVALAGLILEYKDSLKSHLKNLNITLSSTKEGLLTMKGKMAGVDISTNKSNLTLDSLSVAAQGVDQAEKSYLKGKFDYTNLRASLRSDSLELRSGRSSVAFKINHSLGLKFATDTLYLRAVENQFNMNSASVDVAIQGKNFKNLNGKVHFSGINIIVPSFPLPMSMPSTTIAVDNEVITLQGASFKVGDSDMVISGRVANLIASSRGEKPLKVDMDVASSMMNLTQIAHTLNQMPAAESTLTNKIDSTAVAPPDTTELNLFVIPKTIDFDLNTNFKHISFGRLAVDNMKGKVTIKEGVARLDNLSLESMGAKLATTIVYDGNIKDGTANAGLELKSKSIDVHSVVELMPSLDTLMPMLNSFEGKLDFRLLVDTKFYPGFTIKPNEVNATMALRGENLVLLDGSTFDEISKLLMFKNKKRNVVDSIGVQMAVDKGKVEIFPFLIQMDRYRAAIGGEHLLNNTFNYHISILKSPIPFKFGINIHGTLDDMKVGVGKTKYKFLNQPSSVKQINEKYIELGKIISRRISEL